MVSTHMGAQPPLESISTQPSNSFSCNWNTAKNTKLLSDNLFEFLFSNEQAYKIFLDFPTLGPSRREYSRSHMYDQKSSAEMEKIRYLVKTSTKDEESLKVRYEELKKEKYSAEMKKFRDAVENSVRDEEILKVRQEQVENKKKELMKQLEAVQKEKAETAEQRIQKSKNLTKQEAHRNKEEHLMGIATTKLKDLII